MAVKQTRAPKRVELVYKLDGQLREIDIFRLAPALTGIGELIQAAHSELKSDHEVGVNVKPFGRGSFVVEISLFIKDNLPVIGLSASAIAAAVTHTTEILEAIGMIRSKTESLVSAIRKLRGKPTEVEPIGPGEYRYKSPSGEVTVNGNVHQLIQNATIHQAVTYVYAKPTEQEGVTGIETFLKGKQQETGVIVGRDEARVFEDFSNTDLPNPSPVEEYTSGPTTYFLKPKRVSVEGESDNWSFRYGANQTLHVDVVKDEEFLEMVKKGLYRLSSDDLIVAEITQKQKIRGTEILGDPRYELTKIVEYRSAPHDQQQPLFKENPPE